MRYVSTFVMVLFVAGCSKNVWVKPGSNQEDFGRDNLACLQQSQQIESRSGTSAAINSAYGAYESKSRTGAVTNVPMYNSCMNSRGWALRNSSDVAEQAARSKVINDEKRDQVKSIGNQLSELCDRSEFKAYVEKTTCANQDVMSLSMLSDGSRITQKQKIAMDSYVKERDRLQGEQENILNKGADKVLAGRIRCVNEKVKPLYKQNELNLYKGNITWGQYNKSKNDLKGSVKRLCP